MRYRTGTNIEHSDCALKTGIELEIGCNILQHAQNAHHFFVVVFRRGAVAAPIGVGKILVDSQKNSRSEKVYDVYVPCKIS